jgi:gluconolactonase
VVSGTCVDFFKTHGVPLNCTFGNGCIYVCDFCTADAGDAAPMFGRLLKVDAGVSAMPRLRGARS